MRVIEVFARFAEGGKPARWLIPVQRILWVRWWDGVTSIRCDSGLVIDNPDDSDGALFDEVNRALSQGSGTYRVGGTWRFWHEEE